MLLFVLGIDNLPIFWFCTKQILRYVDGERKQVQAGPGLQCIWKDKLGKGVFTRSHILLDQGKFLPFPSIWPRSHWYGITDGTSWGKSLQKFRNIEKSLENNVWCFRTCKEPSVVQGDNRSIRLANRKQQRGRGVVGPKKLLNEVMSDHLSICLLTPWRTILENKPEWPHWSVILMAVLQQVEWIMEGRMICFVQVIAG